MALVKRVAQAKKQLDALQFSYNNDAQKVWALTTSGAKPEEIKAALDAATESWNNYLNAYDKYVNEGEKKGKGKKKAQGAGGAGAGMPSSMPSPTGAGGQMDLSWLQSQDPDEKAQGFLQMARKVGAPIAWQVRQYNSPDAVKQRELARQQQDLAGMETTSKIGTEKKWQRLHELQGKTGLGEEEKKELERLQSDAELFPALAKPQTPHYGTFDISGASLVNAKDKDGNAVMDAFGQPIDPKLTYREAMYGEDKRYIPAVPKAAAQEPKLGTPGAFMKQWAEENHIDPAHIPAETQRQLDQAWKAPSGITVSTHNGQVVWTDLQGNSWKIPITTTTTTARGGAAMPKLKTPGAAASTSTAAPVAKVPAEKAPASATATPPPSTPAPPMAGAQFIGKKTLTPEEKFQNAMHSKDHDKAKKIIDDSKKEYVEAIKRKATMDENIIAARKGDQQAMLSLVANHIGMTLGAQKGARITRAIWDEAIQSAPWTKTIYAKWFHNDPATGDMIFDGYKTGVTLTDQQMGQMVELAHQKVNILAKSIPTMEKLFKEDLEAHAAGGGGSTTTPPTTEKTPPHPVDQILDEMFKK